MSQTSYPVEQPVAFRGMKADSRFDLVESFAAAEIIAFGLGIVKNIGVDNKVRLPAANQGKLVFDADLVTSNTIDMDVNGVAITQVTFATDHDTTMGLIATELETFDDVLSAVLDPLDTNNRTLIVTTNDGEDLLIDSIVVAAGGSQAGGTFTQGTHDTLEGLALATHAKEQARVTGIVQYAISDTVNTLRQGAAYVYVEEAVTSDDPVYCRFLANGTGKDPGQFRKDSDSGKALLVSDVKFKSTTSAAGIAVLEINKP